MTLEADDTDGQLRQPRARLPLRALGKGAASGGKFPFPELSDDRRPWPPTDYLAADPPLPAPEAAPLTLVGSGRAPSQQKGGCVASPVCPGEAREKADVRILSAGTHFKDASQSLFVWLMFREGEA